MRQHPRRPHPGPDPRQAQRPTAEGAPAVPAPEMAKPAPLPVPVRQRRGLDWMVVGGLTLGFALVLSALVLGGHSNAFVNLPSALIVLGGTAAVTLVTFAWEDVAACRRQLIAALTRPLADPADVGGYVLQMAEAARRNGPLSLEPLLKDKGVGGVQARAIELVLDGLAADDAERALRTEIDTAHLRAGHAAQVLRRASDVAPAMGLIGTLAGLVQMLGNLQDPAAIGPAMAIALLTTFYGAMLGNMVLAPLAGKLERNADAQALIDTLFMLGAVSIARQENPRRLEGQLNAVLPPQARQHHYG